MFIREKICSLLCYIGIRGNSSVEYSWLSETRDRREEVSGKAEDSEVDNDSLGVNEDYLSLIRTLLPLRKSNRLYPLKNYTKITTE